MHRYHGGVKGYILIFAEKTVHVFEGPICGFGVEEVYDGDEGSVEYRPDAVVSGQHYASAMFPWEGSTGAFRQCFGTLNWLEQNI